MKTYKERYEELRKVIEVMRDECRTAEAEYAMLTCSYLQSLDKIQHLEAEIERYQHDAAAKGVLYPQARDQA
jgi:hypothetical protein